MKSMVKSLDRMLAIALAILVLGAIHGWSHAGALQLRIVPQSGFRIAPHLQNASPTAITIIWETKKPTPFQVTYWEIGTEEKGRLEVCDDARLKIHRIRITGLKPDTRYGYRVRCGENAREAEFATAPADSRPIRFAIFGDSRFWRNYWQTTPLPQHLLSRRPEFILHMGDLVNDGRKYREWPAHFARFASVLKSVPLFPARGNHERDGSEDPKNNWFATYHELPGGEPYSSFDWGNSHFAIVSYTHIAKCAAFLDADLAATKKKWKFVAFHYPVYCTGYASPSDKRKASGDPDLEAIFDKHRVDMVFSGHTHIYERSFPLRAGKRDDRNGTVYLVQGGAVGGNYPDWWTATIARDLSLPHYSFLDVSDDKIELRSFGLATGDQEKGPDAQIVEIDHYIKWRDEALPARLLSDLPKAAGEKLVNAIENLGAMCYAAAAHVLVGYLSSGDLSVCRAAALALERTADASVSDRLSAFLRDEDIVVRRRAARTLEAAMLPAMADKIVPQILDPAQDSQVRISLLGALLLHARDRALRVAMLALKAGDGDVRDRAADVVKRTATDNDVPILLEMCRSERRPYVAAALAWGLNRIKTQKGSPETTPP